MSFRRTGRLTSSFDCCSKSCFYLGKICSIIGLNWLNQSDCISDCFFWRSPFTNVIGFIGLLMALLIGLVKMHECGPCFFPMHCSDSCYAPLLSSPLLQAVFLLSLFCCVCQLHVLHVFQANECFSSILMPCDRAEFLHWAVLEFFNVKTVWSELVMIVLMNSLHRCCWLGLNWLWIDGLYRLLADQQLYCVCVLVTHTSIK